ncbi:DUF805 domain-containing protein [Bradyrhizobium sp. Arg68]|uniref:DUF805 domain-containing protein n=1 Tax=Bradyrhizobium ivorense TaxID=2511166 RepID=UPI001E3AFBD6|nr:DUF805 domain-containing protein [Bradyrhizobium ivorense]MCC8942167.1 DUF805 domain-containing protein [Bradyrhizobium ivorense]
MLNYLFGFNARMGRLAFFFSSFVVGVGFVMLAYGATGNVPSSGRMDVLLAQASASQPLLFAFYGVLVICFMLQSMRVRDIGWDPVCVMAGWIALMVIDRTVAQKFPEYALTYQHTGTAVGALANAALNLVLLFWPSGGLYKEQEPDDAGSDGAWRPSAPQAAATNRIARIAGGEFGGKAR